MFNEPAMHDLTKMLVNAFIKNPANSIGINGPDGAGKLKVAQHLLSQALDTDMSQFDINVRTLDCSDKGSIDDIRYLKKELSIKTIGSDNFRRAVILKKFNKMSHPAQNATLKLLEEPPLDTILLILTDYKTNILPTIVSRLQWIDVLPLDLDTLKNIYSSYDDAAVKQAFLLSDGYVDNFEQVINGDKSPLMLAVSDAKEFLTMNKAERLANIDRVVKNKNYSQEVFLKALEKIYMILLHGSSKTELNKRILHGLEVIINSKELLKGNSNSKLVFTNLFYKI